ncbi:MAG: hypothetical protein K5644_03450 [Lachnospiraceae bacterium]|nr:hypothetical protein [Lachnospiraceae bacterium]
MKKILSATIFFLILIIILVGLGFLLSPNYLFKNQMVNKKSDISTKLAKEEPYTIDIIVLGDSESYTSISPPELWRDYGYASYNCGGIGATLTDIQDVYQAVLSNQQPKIVLFETNALYRVDGRRKEADNFISDIMHKILPVTKYHDNWKMLFQDTRKGYYKGFTISHTIDPCDNKEYMIMTDDVENVINDNYDTLKDIYKLCKENGASLVLYSAHSQTNYNYAKHNGLNKIAKELNVDYIDMNLLNDDIKIDYTTDTRDRGDHLNVYGASKSTAYIGKYINDNYNITDRRNTNIAKSWDEMLDEYNKELINK